MLVLFVCVLTWVFFLRIFKTLLPLPRQYLVAIGRSEKGQPIGVTVHSDLLRILVTLLPDGDMGCSELGKSTIFNEHSVRAPNSNYK